MYDNIFDFSLFYYSIIVLFALGALSVACKSQIVKVIDILDEKSNGRVAH
ncbi:hypothetical protein Dtox_3583 [Desulfofarcimen acetoxidans DSM 771]|jgi:hypothetical protein|uniref:Uncharacterized protein n=1 Tax=Desulfofarcimen acetoxidans (strain ATCC 49208 / DSM 771 / KCTC 5769 / VKM B-1644 / 5575) TaxID=485916 RepID=C8VW08_DESAS|nr:hypothetical protein [Desulfofarcimen acetoxidans]ACV64295.1 hypothetical protein Dtox_3583 [Desulfofarcimen acetoxidans DSM 771]